MWYYHHILIRLHNARRTAWHSWKQTENCIYNSFVVLCLFIKYRMKTRRSGLKKGAGEGRKKIPVTPLPLIALNKFFGSILWTILELPYHSPCPSPNTCAVVHRLCKVVSFHCSAVVLNSMSMPSQYTWLFIGGTLTQSGKAWSLFSIVLGEYSGISGSLGWALWILLWRVCLKGMTWDMPDLYGAWWFWLTNCWISKQSEVQKLVEAFGKRSVWKEIFRSGEEHTARPATQS